MTADFAQPLTSTERDDVLAYIRDNITALAKMALSGASNIPTGAIQFDSTTRQFQKYNGATWDRLDILPAGVIEEYGGTSAPDGWLLCDGAAVSRTTYADLFTAIGTSYGSGDGSTTFNVPDHRGRFGLGKASAGTGSTLGSTGGSLDHTHTGPSHTHTGPSHTHTGPSHTHTAPAHYHTMGAGATLNIVAGGSHVHAPDLPGSLFWTTNVSAAPSTGTIGYGMQMRGATAAATHTHEASTFSGSIGLVTGGVNGNAAMTSGAGGTGATGASGTAATGAGGTGASGSNNPAYVVSNFIIKT